MLMLLATATPLLTPNPLLTWSQARLMKRRRGVPLQRLMLLLTSTLLFLRLLVVVTMLLLS